MFFGQPAPGQGVQTDSWEYRYSPVFSLNKGEKASWACAWTRKRRNKRVAAVTSYVGWVPSPRVAPDLHHSNGRLIGDFLTFFRASVGAHANRKRGCRASQRHPEKLGQRVWHWCATDWGSGGRCRWHGKDYEHREFEHGKSKWHKTADGMRRQGGYARMRRARAIVDADAAHAPRSGRLKTRWPASQPCMHATHIYQYGRAGGHDASTG